MATLVLSLAGNAILPGVGGFIGAAIGGFIDRQLFGPGDTSQTFEGPRLSNINITTSTEGATVTRLYGRSRVGGQVIWASRFEERKTETTTTQGGGKGGGPTATTTQVSYEYFLSFAVAFCEGNERTALGRVWADGRPIDLSNIDYRFYQGTMDQDPDSLIQMIEGAEDVPAFRGISYLVFESLPLAEFGNRMPQITAEITRPIINDDPDKLENALRGVALIPSTGEFAYGTTPYLVDDGEGNSRAENIHLQRNVSDIVKSIEDLKLNAPNVDTINLVVGWFGDDIRAGSCNLKPKVEFNDKTVTPSDWSVNGIAREDAEEVSRDPNFPDEERPIYGGTPSDQTVLEAIAYLKAQGFRVCFYPFILMDITADNTLPNPYSNGAATVGQPPFPWRGRITCSPAAGYTGTVDKTGTAATQIDAFFEGTWGLRRMVLHYANLCASAGGVDVFFIGSEFVGITQTRSSSSAFPGVSQFVTLAADVAAILPGAQLGYAADWSEYHSHRPNDGSNDVYFNMDPLWASSNIDFISIDNYLPMSDWRNGRAHLDYQDFGPTKIYKQDYLYTQIEGGEYYDYYYADLAARDSQTRTPITDTTYGKPWVYRQKDIRNWWTNAHYNRPGGVESGSPTSFPAATKPFWFSEFGCPAVDKGTNQPNVFYDPKSSESFLPYYSNKRRDDYMQRRYLEAMITYWRDNAGSFDIDVGDFLAWTWDARPYPAYPLRTDVWADGPNYKLGHWLTGRLGVVTLAELVREICHQAGLTDDDIDVTNLEGSNVIVKAFIIENLMSSREMLAPLQQAFLFDSFESGGKLRFVLREDTVFEEVLVEDMVTGASSGAGGFSLTRQKETELPQSVKAQFIDEENSYQAGGATGIKLVGGAKNVVSYSWPIVLDQDYVRALVDIILQESWVGREKGEVVLPLSYIRLDPSDGAFFIKDDRGYYFQITKVTRGTNLRVELSGMEPGLYPTVSHDPGRPPSLPGQQVPTFGKSLVYFADLPLLTGQEDRPWAPRLIGYQKPFPSSITVYRDIGTLELYGMLTKPGALGKLNSDFYSNRPWCWDRANQLIIDFSDTSATLQSATELEVFAGANAVAVQNSDGGWEVVQFVTAELTAPGRYKLTQLLRGQLGTEGEMRDPVAAGSPAFLIDTSAMAVLKLPQSQARYEYTYRYGAAELPTDSELYKEETFQFASVGLQPYAPTRLFVKKVVADGEVLITWERRTRFGGDDWEPEFVPLNEEFELYDLEIYEDGTYATLVRAEELSTTQYTYTAADQIADFGSVQSQFSIRLYQKSASVGRGRKAQQTVYTGI